MGTNNILLEEQIKFIIDDNFSLIENNKLDEFVEIIYDFYINNNSDLIQTNRQISDKWVDLNQNESNQFLSQSGFSQIQKTSASTYFFIITVN